MSIQWVYGVSACGKSTLARKLLDANTIHLDGDDMRRVWPGLGFSETDRQTQNLRVAQLARVIERQGFNVVVSTICPTQELRDKVFAICGCTFIEIQDQRDAKQW